MGRWVAGIAGNKANLSLCLSWNWVEWRLSLAIFTARLKTNISIDNKTLTLRHCPDMKILTQDIRFVTFLYSYAWTLYLRIKQYIKYCKQAQNLCIGAQSQDFLSIVWKQLTLFEPFKSFDAFCTMLNHRKHVLFNWQTQN